MLATEREFVAIIYALYGIDCIHWLKPGEVAFTRGLTGGWKKWENIDGSFTLLGRMPAFLNPLDFRPGLVVFPDRLRIGDVEPAKSIESFLNRSLPERNLLTIFSALASLNFLVLLPVILIFGLFEFWWMVPCGLMLSTHVTIAFEVYAQAKPWRAADPGKFWQEYISLIINPIAELRCGDVLCRNLFDLEVKSNRNEED